ncbi:MAG: LysE family translocator [Pseudomonadota bacterium]
MNWDALLGMLIAALALMGSPGPATLSVAATSAVFGLGRAIPYYCGICCGTSTVVLLVGTGVMSLVMAVPSVTPILVILAGAYILYLAFRIATAPPLKAQDDSSPPPRAIAGYLLAIANPKAYAAMGALFAGYVLIARDPQADAITKAIILIALVFTVNLVWLIAGRALAQFFQSERSARILNVSFAVLLVASLIPLLIS